MEKNISIPKELLFSFVRSALMVPKSNWEMAEEFREIATGFFLSLDFIEEGTFQEFITQFNSSFTSANGNKQG